jgi:hypothetical protein
LATTGKTVELQDMQEELQHIVQSATGVDIFTANPSFLDALRTRIERHAFDQRKQAQQIQVVLEAVSRGYKDPDKELQSAAQELYQLLIQSATKPTEITIDGVVPQLASLQERVEEQIGELADAVTTAPVTSITVGKALMARRYLVELGLPVHEELEILITQSQQDRLRKIKEVIAGTKLLGTGNA